LYEIGLIKEALARAQPSGKGSELTDEELVEYKLPCPYWEFKDVFSKEASNMLPPHRPYDHKIEIEPSKENTFSYSPLYQQSTAKLQATSSILLITWIRASLSLAKPLSPHLFSLLKSQMEDFVFASTTAS